MNELDFVPTKLGSSHTKVSGGYTGGATPDPIPNSEVKPSRADGTAGETLWESRSSPGNFSDGENRKVLPVFFVLRPGAEQPC